MSGDAQSGLPQPAKHAGARVWLVASVLVPLLLGLWLVTNFPARRVGDGADYLIATWALKQRGTPAFDEATVRSFNRSTARAGVEMIRPLGIWQIGYERRIRPESGFEAIHFWWYSLLAVPFAWLCERAGQVWVHGFTWLHMAMLALMLGYASLRHRWRGFVAVLVVCLASPLVWFLNKAHTEVLTVFCVVMATLLVAEKRILWAALFLSGAAAQNAALSLPATLMILWGLWQWWHADRRPIAPLAIAAAAIALNALSPIHYLIHYGYISPITVMRHFGAELIGPKRMLSILIDPNLGLLPNWPIGALILIVATIAVAVSRRRTGHWPWRGHKELLWFAALFVVTILPVQAGQKNLNHGGTIHVTRYVFWYIGFWVPVLIWLLGRSRVLSFSLAVPVAALAALNASAFCPRLPENAFTFAPQAAWFYRHFPGWHRPVHEIWIERGWSTKDVKARDNEPTLLPGVWAVANPDCTQLLVLALQLDTPGTRYTKPAGCMEPIDGAALQRDLQSSITDRSRDTWLLLNPSQLSRYYVGLKAAEPALFGSGAVDRILGAGWSSAEPTGRWTLDHESRIGFRMDGASRGILYMDAGSIFPERVGEQRVEVQINGATAANWVWTRQHVPQVVQVPIQADNGGRVRVTLRHANPIRPGGADQRNLAVFVRRMWWEAK